MVVDLFASSSWPLPGSLLNQRCPQAGRKLGMRRRRYILGASVAAQSVDGIRYTLPISPRLTTRSSPPDSLVLRRNSYDRRSQYLFPSTSPTRPLSRSVARTYQAYGSPSSSRTPAFVSAKLPLAS